MFVACVVCARPLDSLLTSGLHAGVAVLALLAVTVVGALAWGVRRIVIDDALADAVRTSGPEATP